MAIVLVNQLKNADRLSEDVHTKLGNVLMNKGKYINSRDIEVLKAFFVNAVSIESKGIEEVAEQKIEDPENPIMHFYEEYDRMLILMRKVFTLANSGESLPILDIRTRLEKLVLQIQHYNVLTFNPRNVAIGDYNVHNAIMVALTSYQIALWRGLLPKDLLPIALAGLFHDIGNAKIDESLLNKVGKLTNDELDEIRKHCVYGYNILKGVPAINEGVKLTALQHHEKEDGSGYPMGVTGDKIHPYSKIVSVADIFHAMTLNRNHKKALSPYIVLEQLMKESFGKLDPLIVQMFIEKVTRFTNGTLVKLSDNRIGEIVFSDRNNLTRPMISINGVILNLATVRNIYIQQVIRN